MKTVRFIGMAVMMAVMSFGFAACSGDDDEDGGGSGSGALIKQIIGVTDSDDDCTFEYDAMGRVIKANSRNSRTYTYGENAIYVNGSKEYELSHGRIVKEGEYDTHAYDNNGYLHHDGDGSDDYYTYTWKDGNLVKYGNKYQYWTVTYSKMKWPKGWMHYWKGTEMDAYLEPSGAWGKMPKNLPSVVTEYNGDGSVYRTFTFEYVVENNRITQLIETVNKPNESYYNKSWVYQFVY